MLSEITCHSYLEPTSNHPNMKKQSDLLLRANWYDSIDQIRGSISVELNDLLFYSYGLNQARKSVVFKLNLSKPNIVVSKATESKPVKLEDCFTVELTLRN